MGCPSGVQCDLRCNRQENSFIASQKSRPQLDIAIWGAILSSLPDRRKPSNRISGNWHLRSDGRDSGRMVGKPEGIRLLPHPPLLAKWGILYDVAVQRDRAAPFERRFFC